MIYAIFWTHKCSINCYIIVDGFFRYKLGKNHRNISGEQENGKYLFNVRKKNSPVLHSNQTAMN
jgi:hypothetical protein